MSEVRGENSNEAWVERTGGWTGAAVRKVRRDGRVAAYLIRAADALCLGTTVFNGLWVA